MESVKVFLTENDITDKKVSARSSYEAEINSLVDLLNNNIGRTWNHCFRAKANVNFGGNVVNPAEYPWIKIKNSVDYFPEYFKKKFKIFDIDPT